LGGYLVILDPLLTIHAQTLARIVGFLTFAPCAVP
jgi:hypothetical protein